MRVTLNGVPLQLKNNGLPANVALAGASVTSTLVLEKPKLRGKFKLPKIPRFSIRNIQNIKKLVQVLDVPMVTIQIKPAKLIVNTQGIHSIYNAAHAMRKRFDERWWFEGLKLVYERPELISFVTAYDYTGENLEVKFYLVVPESRARHMMHVLKSSPWGKSEIRVVDIDPLSLIGDPSKSAISEWVQKEHLFKSIDTDLSSLSPIASKLGAGRVLNKGDYAVMDVTLKPTGEHWKRKAVLARDKWLSDKEVKPIFTGSSNIFLTLLDLVVNSAVEIPFKLMDALLNVDPEAEMKKNKSLYSLLNDNKRRKTSESTNSKPSRDGFSVVIRVAATSEERKQAEKVVKAIGVSLKDVTEDNELVEVPIPPDNRFLRPTTRAIQRLKDRKQSAIGNILEATGVANNIMSIPEVAKLNILPVASLQEQYPEVAQQLFTDSLVDGILLKDSGIPFVRTTTIPEQVLYYPTSNLDDMCISAISLGGMGSGKTTFATSEASYWFGNHIEDDNEWCKKGKTIFLFDVTDGDMLREFIKCVPPSRRGRIIIQDFSNADYPIACTFDEARKYGLNSSQSYQLGVQTVEFLEDLVRRELGDRGRKYFMLISMGVFEREQGCISEVVRSLTDIDFLCNEILPFVRTRKIRKAIMEFASLDEKKRNEYIEPILNRSYNLEYNNLLWNSIAQPPNPNIDYRKWMDGDEGGPYAVLTWVPNSLGRETQNAIMAQQVRKLWFATLTRGTDTPDPNDRKPFLAVFDEIHQYVKANSFFKDMFREARKFRMAVRLLFHEWGAIQDKELADAIMGAEPNIFLLKGAEANYDKLKNSLIPFTKEEFMQMPYYHAICKIRAGGKDHVFGAHLFDKFSKRYENYNNEDLWEISAKKYGRRKEEVERMVDFDFDEDADIVSKPEAVSDDLLEGI